MKSIQKPKQNKAAVFDLIKTLSKAEKRRFKLDHSHATSTRSKAFLKLFDIIDKQEVFDEAEILEKEPAIKRQQLPNLKRYLYQQILRSLNDQYSESDIDRRAQQMLGHVKTLFDRGLYQQCRVMVSQAKHFAHRYELRHVLLQLLSWEEKLQIVNVDKNIKKFDAQHERTLAEERKKSADQLFQSLRTETDLYHLRNQVFISIRKERFTRQVLLPDFQGQLEDHPLLMGEESKGFRNEYLRQTTLGIYSITLGDYRKSFRHFKNVIQLLEAYPHFNDIDPRMYGVALYNFTLNCVRLSRYDDYFRVCLEKLRQEAEKGGVQMANAQCIELVFYSSRGAFKEGEPVADRIVEQIAEQGVIGTFFIETDLYFDLSYIYFGAGKHEQALIWLNKIIQSKAINVVKDLYSVARIVQLIIHYELGNTLILKSLSKSLTLYLKKRESQYRFEKVFIDFFQKIKRENKLKLYRELHSKIAALQSDPEEARMLEYFDFASWVESKLQAKPFEEVVKEQYVADNSD